MADLDDFFAKKDRKKKTTKKFATTEEVAKKLEDTAKKTEKPKKERGPEGEEGAQQVIEQDEWKEFEEEKKDYTGLKIGNLTINPNEEIGSLSQDLASGDQTNGSELTAEGEKKAGPWRRMDVPQESPQQQEEPPRPVEKKQEPTKAASETTTYRPPAMRHHNTAPSIPTLGRLRGNRGAAPDIHNEEYFPTLSKTGDGKRTRGEGNFEVVQQHRASSYRQQMEQSKGSSGPQLNLGNRYNTLSNDS
ncbi:protein CDV3 homolog [Euwallacea fornicatus]|uniref:protein CDV3 homolog n=1 Tax=Euwallacea fornicatus TaxID=995702 RepID=UPI00338FFFE7